MEGERGPDEKLAVIFLPGSAKLRALKSSMCDRFFLFFVLLMVKKLKTKGKKKTLPEL